MPTLVVGMYGNTGKQGMPTTSVGMAPIGNHFRNRNGSLFHDRSHQFHPKAGLKVDMPPTIIHDG